MDKVGSLVKITLCTKDAVEAASVANAQCASGFWVERRDAEANDIEYGQGWFVGEDHTAECPGTSVGENSWKPASGNGAAHCCVKPYVKSGYGALGTNVTPEGAAAYCSNLGYSYQVCTKDQLERVVSMEYPSPCMAGFLDGEGDSHGWWQGEYTVAGCGAANTYYSLTHGRAGAHCCLSSVQGPALLGGPYGILPSTGAYQQSEYTTGVSAETGCMDAGYDQLCTLGQQAYVEMNAAIYGDIACKVGWVVSDGGYDAGYYGNCGAADAWNNNWRPAAGNPVAHCCASDTPELEMTAYPYYNGDWDQYATQDEAAAYCTGDYSLCTKDQLRKIATEEVEYNDVTQQESSICRLGWTAEGEMGWWQGEVTTCGNTGWRTFTADKATYHCCLPFEATFGTTEPPTPDVFTYGSFEGETLKYPFNNAADALAACQNIHVEYSLCSDYELEEVTVQGVDGIEGWNGVEPQNGLCYTGWLDADRSQEYSYGWYNAGGELGCGVPGWTEWLQGGEYAGAFCCYSEAFADPETSTEAPTTTTTTTTTTTSTEAPTAVADSLPSSVAAPADCVDVGFSIADFDELQWCASDGTVYLNGRDTCVASAQEAAELESALTNVWENSWYLASGECTGDRSYDDATADQLWITNEMCNNLEADISDLETQTADYMDGWIQSVVDLVNANMENFDTDTQNALSDYLVTLQD